MNTDPTEFPNLKTVHSLPRKVILDWLVDNEVVVDTDKANSLLLRSVGTNLMNEGSINLSEFTKLFQKGMFKTALTRLQLTLEQQVREGKISDQLSLARKLEIYQRSNHVRGIMDTSSI